MLTEQRLTADRRGESRRTADGEVQLCQSQMPGGEFVGYLVDIAVTGFRARHNRFTLGSGDLVNFEFKGHCGVARAMWTRIIADQVETGFRICRDNGPPVVRASPVRDAG
jgi:hypothetical protein